MWKLELESEILKEMLSNWDQFLFSNNIYWPIQIPNRHFSAQERRVQVTCGRLLISTYLLEKSQDNLDSQVILDLKKFDQMKNKWLSNWRLKVTKELTVRINDWSRLISTLKSDLSTTEFNNRVQIRLMIDLLMKDLGEEEKENIQDLVSSLDDKFTHLTIDNGFVWEDKFIKTFPNKEFWYLYRSLK